MRGRLHAAALLLRLGGRDARRLDDVASGCRRRRSSGRAWSGAAEPRPILELPLGPAWDAAGDLPVHAPSPARAQRRERLRSAALRAAQVRAGRPRSRVAARASRRSAPSTSSSMARTIPTARGPATWRAFRGRRSAARMARGPCIRFQPPFGPRSGSGRSLPIVSAWANSQEGSLAVDGRMETEWNDGRRTTTGTVADCRPRAGARGRRRYARARRVRAGLSAAAGDRSLARRLELGGGLAGPDRGLAFLAATRAPSEAAMRFAFAPRRSLRAPSPARAT